MEIFLDNKLKMDCDENIFWVFIDSFSVIFMLGRGQLTIIKKIILSLICFTVILFQYSLIILKVDMKNEQKIKRSNLILILAFVIHSYDLQMLVNNRKSSTNKYENLKI